MAEIPISGTWKLATIPGALKVGPNFNDGSWWSSSLMNLFDRSCHFDDSITFSPNGDGANDFLFVRGRKIKSLTFIVYNRWGEKVFETETQSECWDGMFRNKELNSGTFAYKFNATLIDGTVIEQSGNLTLVR